MPPPWWTGWSSTCAISAPTTSSATRSTAMSVRDACCRRRRRGRSPRSSVISQPAGSASRCSIATARCARSRISCDGRGGSTTRKQGRILSRHRQARSVQARLHRGPLRSFARLDRRPHAGAAADNDRARHGNAVRFLRPAVLGRGQERERRGAEEPRAVRRGDDPRRLSAYHKEWWHFTLANEPFPTPISIFRCGNHMAFQV